MYRKGNVQRDMAEKAWNARTQLIMEASEEEVNIELAIREKYSLSQEIALHRKKMMGIDDEWDDYCAYVRECIERARSDA